MSTDVSFPESRGPKGPITPPSSTPSSKDQLKGDKSPALDLPQKIIAQPEGPSFAQPEGPSFDFQGHMISLTQQMDLPEFEKELREKSEGLMHGIKLASAIDLNKASSLVDFVKEHGIEIIDKLIEHLKRPMPEDSSNLMDSMMIRDPFAIPFLECLELLTSQAAANVRTEDLLDQIEIQAMGGDDWVKGMAAAESSIILGNILGTGGVFIAMAVLISKAKEVLESKKQALSINEDTKLSEEIKILENWIAQQSSLLKKQAVRSTITTALAIPKAGSAILHLADMSATTAGTTFGWMVSGVSLVTSAIQWRKATVELDEHKVWAATFQANTPEQLDALVKKQKEVHETRQKKDNSEASLKRKEALSVSLRQALKTFIHKKTAIDRGFLKLALGKAKALFTTTTIITALTIILKILFVVGIITATGAIVATGYGVLAAAIILGIIGIAYLAYKKPNLFKTFLQGIQIKLAFKKLASAIQKYRHQNANFQTARFKAASSLLSADLLQVQALLKNPSLTIKDLPESLQKKFKPKFPTDEVIEIRTYLQKYSEELFAKIRANERKAKESTLKQNQLNESINNIEKQIQELQTSIKEAAWKDYQRHLHGKESTLLKDVQGNIIKKDSRGNIIEDDATVLAEYLLQDETLLEDTETAELLKKIDIDLLALRRQHPDPHILQKEVAQAIRSFFALDDQQTLKLIHKQQLQASFNIA